MPFGRERFPVGRRLGRGLREWFRGFVQRYMGHPLSKADLAELRFGVFTQPRSHPAGSDHCLNVRFAFLAAEAGLTEIPPYRTDMPIRDRKKRESHDLLRSSPHLLTATFFHLLNPGWPTNPRRVPDHSAATSKTRRISPWATADSSEAGRSLSGSRGNPQRSPGKPGDPSRGLRHHPLVDRRNPPRAGRRQAAYRHLWRTGGNPRCCRKCE